MYEVVDALLKEAIDARREHRAASAKHLLVEALDLCRKSNDRGRLAKTLTALGQAERDLSHLDTARQHYEEVAFIYHADGQPLRLAHTIRHIGDIHLDEGNLDKAERCYQAALDLYRQNAETPPLDLANTLRGMAILKGDLGHKEQARILWQEAGELYASVDVKAGVAESQRRITLLSKSNSL